MSCTIISVEKLGKEYVIGGRENASETFREMIVSAAMAPFRRLKHLGGNVVSDDRIWALKDVSFEVKEGEVLGIVGRNGAGKSTLLKILSRITSPTEGRIEIRGRVSSLLEVGTGFHPELTGRENIYLNGTILGMRRTEIDQKFDEIVDFSGVEKFLDTPVKRYSSGMCVRLAFAVAAHLEPEILIVDEVLAVGDAEFQAKCLGKMKDVAGGGRTVLLVSHNLTALKRICQTGILIDGGTIISAGDIERCLTDYTETNQERSIYRKPNQGTNRNSNIHDISIVCVECLSPAVFQGAEFALYVEVDVWAPTRRVVFGVGFCDATGGRILSSDSDFVEMKEFNFSKTGRYALRFQIDKLPLAAAHYNLDVGCRFTNGRMIDNIQNALVISVRPSKETTTVQATGYTTAVLSGTWELSTPCSDQRRA
jgi:lipopolysaccharide transport system ATP-binding protein